MLPASLTFHRPDGLTGGSDTGTVSLGADDVKRLVLSLHGAAVGSYDQPEESKLVQRWVCEDNIENHSRAWHRLLDALGVAA